MAIQKSAGSAKKAAVDAVFKWKGVDRKGQPMQGELRATSEAAAREFLRMAEDGDPALFDRFQEPHFLSGEWADSMTPNSLVCHSFDTEFPTDWEDAQDEICLAYERAASDGFWGRLEECAALVLDH